MTRAATQFDVAPGEALQAVGSHTGPLLIDFDETLYLRNSTEDFLDCARPGLLALLLLRALDVLKPWRWTGGAPTRDVWRVRVVGWVLPWTWRIWRSRAPALGARFANRRLLAELGASRGSLVVASVGFRPIVAPLLEAMGLKDARLLATDRSWLASRRLGKLRSLESELGDQAVARSLVLTDSEDDLPLLQLAARPLRTLWPEARYRAALGHVYLPGQYLTRVKRPGERYIWRGILREDFANWVLSSLALASSSPFLHVAGLSLLLVSFWAIYEIGYVDNDHVAAIFESDPKLSEQFRQGDWQAHRWQPWIWALAAGWAGTAVLRHPAPPSLLDVGRWYAVLAATFAWFHFYNRMDKASRIWLFGGLQFARAAAFTVLVPIVPVAVAGLGALVLVRWMEYFAYRKIGNWPKTPQETARVLFFVLLAAFLGISGGFALVLSWTALAFLAWNALWARKDLRAILSAASRIARKPS